MKSTKIRGLQIFRTLSLPDKLFVVLLAVMGIGLFANGLYLVGHNGLLLLVGAIGFHIITRIFRNAEIEIITKGLKDKESAQGNRGAKGSAEEKANDGLIQSIIDKRKQHPQQGLLDRLGDDLATPQRDEEQARADHEFLVEMARKKQEAMRTAVPGPSLDPRVEQEVIAKQEAYVKELMKPTIVPQRELSEKAAKKKEQS